MGEQPRLDPAQARAVEQTEGPLLIIAGPGSGKTHTLVERTVRLITERGVLPDQILLCTFTEKAAAELVTRITLRLAEIGHAADLAEMFIGTLHSICLRILDEFRERTRLKRNFVIWDKFDQQYALYRDLNTFQEVDGAPAVLGPAGAGSRWRQAEVLAARLNQVSEELLDVVELEASPDLRIRALARLHNQYSAFLAERNALDFSLIQVEACRLLELDAEVLAGLRSRLRYAMVDEYQDTNTVQERLLRLLAGEAGNLCVVGDDDQALYRFRGATVRNILEFPDSFSPCSREHLTVNYRSQPGIVDFYSSWMSGHDWMAVDRTMRFNKEIKAARAESIPRPHVLKVTATPGSWDDEVVAFLRALQESGRLDDWNQVTFLFRSVRNKEVLRLARRLEGEGIPVYSPRSNLFFERDEVRWMIGALIMLFPQFDHVVRASWKGEHPEIFDWYENSAAAFLDTIEAAEHADLRKWMGYRRRDHGGLAEETDYAFSGLFYQLLAFPIFARFLDGAAAHGGVRDSRAARNLATVSRLLTRFESWHGVTVLSPRFIESNLRNLFANYLRFLFDGGIDEFEDETDFAPPGCVSFMTIHQAKGLQFPITVVGLPATGPRKQHDDLDEALQATHYHKSPLEPLERTKHYDFWRLYYTAFSRAQDLLVLTTPEKLEGAGRRVPCAEFQDLVCGTPSWRQHADNLAHTGLSRTARAEIKARYSFTSHITVFENCARQYEFFKDLEFTPVRSNAIIFGTLVHQTIEDVHKAVIQGQTGHLQPESVETWLRDNYRSLSRRERRYLSEPAIRSALGHVLRYIEGRAGAWGDVLATEVDVSLVRDTYILSGSIDLLQGDGDTLEVVDFKSEPKPDLVRDADRLLRYRRQLEIYGQLVSKRTGKRVSRLHLHYTGSLHGNPRISYDMDPHRVERTLQGFDDVVARIEANDFEIHERPEHLCKNCDLKPYCDRKGIP